MNAAAIAGDGAGLPDLTAIITQELKSLAADAQTLRTRISPGDTLQAIVLPSNGLTDLVDIGGLRVAAALPPTVFPGDVITVTVTSFAEDRINLLILPGARSAGNSATIETRAQQLVPAQPGASESALRGASGLTAPGAGALGAAALGTDARSLPELAEPGLPTLRGASVPSLRSGVTSSVASAERPTGLPPASTASPARSSPAALQPIEARLATARATGSPDAAAKAPPRPPGVPPAGQIAAMARPPMAVRGAVPLPVGLPVAPATGRAASLASYADLATLLRAAQLAVTPSSLVAAKAVLETPERLAHILATLDSALANRGGAQAATVRTIIGFLARLEPRSPVLATQIATFVDQVITGREVKLVQLLKAFPPEIPIAALETDRPPPPLSAPSSGSLVGRSAAPADPNSLAADGGLAIRSDSEPAAGAEQVALRQAALDGDLKTQLQVIALAGRVSGGVASAKSGGLEAAIGGALGAITALQVNAAATLAANPDGLAFALPIALSNGFAHARVRIDRDAPQFKNVPLDGDNFHIGFVLDTQHLGTVSIDLLTVGRSVTLALKTEAEIARRTFAGALADLTQRLESLRYRVAAADASIAPAASSVTPTTAVRENPSPASVASETPPPLPSPDVRLVDLDA